MLEPKFPYFEKSEEIQKVAIHTLHKRLNDHFGSPVFRSLPVLEELILTVLSQNTTDRNRDKAYLALRENFPYWESIADAPTERLIEILRPAGLAPQKAPRIKTIIQIAVAKNDLEMNFVKNMEPEIAEEYLLSLPGVGIKTAYCTMLFSCDMNVYPMDTHIIRIFKRTSLIPEKPNVLAEHRRISRMIANDCKKENHLNVIQLGKEICKARSPRCSTCPVSDLCRYYSNMSKTEERGKHVSS